MAVRNNNKEDTQRYETDDLDLFEKELKFAELIDTPMARDDLSSSDTEMPKNKVVNVILTFFSFFNTKKSERLF